MLLIGQRVGDFKKVMIVDVRILHKMHMHLRTISLRYGVEQRFKLLAQPNVGHD
ncbi:hypothetical protein D3C85_1844680 [compost metagenome]